MIFVAHEVLLWNIVQTLASNRRRENILATPILISKKCIKTCKLNMIVHESTEAGITPARACPRQ